MPLTLAPILDAKHAIAVAERRACLESHVVARILRASERATDGGLRKAACETPRCGLASRPAEDDVLDDGLGRLVRLVNVEAEAGAAGFGGVVGARHAALVEGDGNGPDRPQRVAAPALPSVLEPREPPPALACCDAGCDGVETTARLHRHVVGQRPSRRSLAVAAHVPVAVDAWVCGRDDGRWLYDGGDRRRG